MRIGSLDMSHLLAVSLHISLARPRTGKAHSSTFPQGLPSAREAARPTPCSFSDHRLLADLRDCPPFPSAKCLPVFSAKKKAGRVTHIWLACRRAAHRWGNMTGKFANTALQAIAHFRWTRKRAVVRQAARLLVFPFLRPAWFHRLSPLSRWSLLDRTKIAGTGFT
jgi:hypothetical protein